MPPASLSLAASATATPLPWAKREARSQNVSVRLADPCCWGGTSYTRPPLQRGHDGRQTRLGDEGQCPDFRIMGLVGSLRCLESCTGSEVAPCPNGSAAMAIRPCLVCPTGLRQSCSDDLPPWVAGESSHSLFVVASPKGRRGSSYTC